MSPASLYRGSRRTRNIDAGGVGNPRAAEYHKPVYVSALVWNRATHDV